MNNSRYENKSPCIMLTVASDVYFTIIVLFLFIALSRKTM